MVSHKIMYVLGCLDVFWLYSFTRPRGSYRCIDRS
jgi:hypothetical protein